MGISTRTIFYVTVGAAILGIVICLLVYTRGNGNNGGVTVDAHTPTAYHNIEHNPVVENPSHYNDEQDIAMDSGSKLPGAVVLFHAEWCGHCKTLAPIWQSLVGELSQTHPQITILDLKEDQQGAKELGQSVGVKGFPTIVYFPGGPDEPEKAVMYNGDRSKDDLRAFILAVNGVQ